MNPKPQDQARRVDPAQRKAQYGLTDWTRRRHVVAVFFAILGAILVVRAVSLQVFDHEFYRGQGDARQLRTVAMPAHRGMLLDRDGEPLAISTPIQTLWGVPGELVDQPVALTEVASVLGMDAGQLISRVEKAAKLSPAREFIYVKRHVPPMAAAEVMALNVAGLSVQREYRRYYPSGRASAHMLGFTDIDDRGREGLEMAYDNWLSGTAGSRRVVRDRTGREITARDVIQAPVPGKDLRLSIDKQLQYFADRALVEAVGTHKAQSGSVVVMDVHSGEVAAIANYPAYNPNDMRDRSGGRQRNRAITDVFEPGSTMKPFTIAAALDSGKFEAGDVIYTSPGYYTIGKYQINDFRDYGWLDLRGIIRKSSNVGISKVARQLEPTQMWSVFDDFGFGRAPGTEFPGEVAGYFNHSDRWHRAEQASISYGYGISVSALQLARAYSALAADGVMPPVSFLDIDHVDGQANEGKRVMNEAVALEIQGMLESVVTEGTGHRAGVPGYRVAGKTGTTRLSKGGGYAKDRYVSLFAGFAPVSDPAYAVVVVIHDPNAGEYFGSLVAAPVFAQVMSHALRLGGVEPDAVDGISPELPNAAAEISAPRSTQGGRS